jgi:death-on-curing protein
MHAVQVDRFGGSLGVLDQGAFEGAAARPRNRFHYGEGADLADLAAAYLAAFAGSHGFVDGNKRIGAAAMLVFLAINGKPLHVAQPELYGLVMDVARGRIEESQVAAWIRGRI